MGEKDVPNIEDKAWLNLAKKTDMILGHTTVTETVLSESDSVPKLSATEQYAEDWMTHGDDVLEG